MWQTGKGYNNNNNSLHNAKITQTFYGGANFLNKAIGLLWYCEGIYIVNLITTLISLNAKQ